MNLFFFFQRLSHSFFIFWFLNCLLTHNKFQSENASSHLNAQGHVDEGHADSAHFTERRIQLKSMNPFFFFQRLSHSFFIFWFLNCLLTHMFTVFFFFLWIFSFLEMKVTRRKRQEILSHPKKSRVKDSQSCLSEFVFLPSFLPNPANRLY